MAEELYPLPDNVLLHLQHLRDFVAADPSTVTLAQTAHVLQDVIRVLHYEFGRVQDEG